MNRTERIERLDQFIADGRLIRRDYFDRDDRGRELACLYAAMVPECDESTEHCPADLMWQWLADCVPWIDDAGTEEQWPTVIRRFAAIMRDLPTLGEDDGERIKRDWLRLHVLPMARANCPASRTEAIAAIDGVIALYQEWHDTGVRPDDQRWDAARAAAAAAEWDAASAAERLAALAAERAAALAAEWVSTSASARAAVWASAAASAAEWAEKMADTLIDALLTLLEQAIKARGAE